MLKVKGISQVFKETLTTQHTPTDTHTETNEQRRRCRPTRFGKTAPPTRRTESGPRMEKANDSFLLKNKERKKGLGGLLRAG